MKADDGRRFIYEKNQLVEVICQLRFPAILSIDSETPAAFQEKVRARYPRYAVMTEKKNGAPDIRNHAFISGDAKHKISLTREFIAFSTMGYADWTETYVRGLARICRALAAEFDVVCHMAAGLPHVWKGAWPL